MTLILEKMKVPMLMKVKVYQVHENETDMESLSMLLPMKEVPSPEDTIDCELSIKERYLVVFMVLYHTTNVLCTMNG